MKVTVVIRVFILDEKVLWQKKVDYFMGMIRVYFIFLERPKMGRSFSQIYTQF